jgi:hypothetical protein
MLLLSIGSTESNNTTPPNRGKTRGALAVDWFEAEPKPAV